jgi:hypothetical protein
MSQSIIHEAPRGSRSGKLRSSLLIVVVPSVRRHLRKCERPRSSRLVLPRVATPPKSVARLCTRRRRHAWLGAIRQGPLALLHAGTARQLRIPLLLLAVTTPLISSASALASRCPNEGVRDESNVNVLIGQPYSTQLPECRAYELVSPEDTGGVAVASMEEGNEATPRTGDRLVEVMPSGAVLYVSRAALPATGDVGNGRSLDVYASRRGDGGWQTTDLTPFAHAGENELIAGTPSGAGALIITPVTLSPEDLDNPLGVVAPQGGAGPALDLYLVEQGHSPLFVSHGDLPRTVPQPNETEITSPYVYNEDLTAVGFMSATPLDLRGVSASATDCYSWSDVSVRVAAPTNPDDDASSNCSLLGMTRDGRAIFEDTSGDGRGGGIFVDSIGSEGTQFPRGSSPAVQLSGNEPDATTFDAISPSGAEAYVTSTEAFAPSQDANSGADVYAVSVPLFPGETQVPQEADVTCISCSVTGSVGGASFVAQSPDGSHVLFSTDNGLWSWNWQDETVSKLTEATDVSQIVMSANGDYVVGLTHQLADNPNGTADIYEFASGQVPSLITAGTSADEYTLTSKDLAIEGEYGLYSEGAVSNDGTRIVYDNSPSGGGPEVIDEWSAGQTTQISPVDAVHPYWTLGASGDALEDIFFLGHEPLVAQDHNAGTLDIYDARTEGGFPAPSEAPNGSQTPNPADPAPVPYGANLSVPALTPDTLPPDSATPILPATRPKPTRAQELAKALKACKKAKDRRRRAWCERKAIRAYKLDGNASSRRERKANR